MKFDVAIIGGGMAGMATALRLQARGLSTVVLEAHGQPGGCAGYFRRRGFSFDVGATTLVDFEPGGVGGELLESVGLPAVVGENLPGYVAWLPDRVVTLRRDPNAWGQERLRSLGDSPAHRAFWQLIDRLAAVFWRASRRGARLPIKGARELSLAVRSIGPRDLLLVRYLGWTMGDALRAHGLRGERPLVGLLSMLIEDTLLRHGGRRALDQRRAWRHDPGRGPDAGARRHAGVLARADAALREARRRAARRLRGQASRRPCRRLLDRDTARDV